jgi:outer membrane biosynthesis protein TonB
VPAAALAGAGGGGPLRNLLESLLGAAQHKTAAMSERLHAAAELATGQKVAAVAASAAALAGGGTAIDEFANHQGSPLPKPVQRVEPQPVKEEDSAEPAPPAAEVPPAESAPSPEPAPPPAPAPEPASPPPDPAAEFAPGGSATPAPSEPSPAQAPTRPAGGEFTSSAGGGGGAGGAGEFAP